MFSILCSERPLDPADVGLGIHSKYEGGLYPASTADLPRFVSNYYINPDLTSRAGVRATTINPDKRPSFDNMSQNDLAVNFDWDAAKRSDIPCHLPLRSAFEKLTEAALFNEALAKKFLPGMQIVWIACPQSMWALEWCKVLFERRYEECIKENRQVRPIRFMEIEGANHFVSVPLYFAVEILHLLMYLQVHWDEPKKFWEATVDALSNMD